MADAEPVPPPTAWAEHGGELRAFIAEQAALLRSELLACLKEAVAPILAESVALRAWQGRALSFIDKACGPLPPPQPAQPPTMVTNCSPRGFEEDAGLADQTPFVDDGAILGQLELLHLSSPDQEIDDGALGLASLGLASPILSTLPASPVVGTEAWDAAAHLTVSREPASPILSPRPSLPSPGQRSTASPPGLGVDRSIVAGDPVQDAVAAAPLQEFLASVTRPVLQPLLGTPASRQKKTRAIAIGSPRRSGRIAIKKKV
jgi:hypothetical protein